MVDEHSIADSAAPADTATAATLLAQVAAGRCTSTSLRMVSRPTVRREPM